MLTVPVRLSQTTDEAWTAAHDYCLPQRVSSGQATSICAVCSMSTAADPESTPGSAAAKLRAFYTANLGTGSSSSPAIPVPVRAGPTTRRRGSRISLRGRALGQGGGGTNRALALSAGRARLPQRRAQPPPLDPLLIHHTAEIFQTAHRGRRAGAARMTSVESGPAGSNVSQIRSERHELLLTAPG